MLSFILFNFHLGPFPSPNYKLAIEFPAFDNNAQNSPQNILPFNTADFIPNEYSVMDTLITDVNYDNILDYIFIVQGTDTEYIIYDDIRGQMNLNRRGIVIILSNGNSYEVSISNYSLFHSDHEDGGIYFSPELSISAESINKSLNIHYSHGRYGYSSYEFQYLYNNFYLVHYYSVFRSSLDTLDYVLFDESEVDFLSHTKLYRQAISIDSMGYEIYKNNYEEYPVKSLVKLSEIEELYDLKLQ